MALVAGKGVYNRGKYQARHGQEWNPYYLKWANMLRRCYTPAYRKLTPAYEGCDVADEFLEFQNFMLWAEKQYGFGHGEFHLDKDVLSGSCKIYSPETCVFVPLEINTLLNNCPTQRGKNKVGVYFDERYGVYRARVTAHNKTVNLGTFKSEDEAFSAYKVAKENNVKRVAEMYVDCIDPRVYAKLIDFKI